MFEEEEHHEKLGHAEQEEQECWTGVLIQLDEFSVHHVGGRAIVVGEVVGQCRTKEGGDGESSIAGHG